MKRALLIVLVAVSFCSGQVRRDSSVTNAGSLHQWGPARFDSFIALLAKLRIGDSTVPTALLHLAASTGAAGTAPIKLTAGTFLATPEPGTFEYNGIWLTLTRDSGVRDTLNKTQSSGGGGGSSGVFTRFTRSYLTVPGDYVDFRMGAGDTTGLKQVNFWGTTWFKLGVWMDTTLAVGWRITSPVILVDSIGSGNPLSVGSTGGPLTLYSVGDVTLQGASGNVGIGTYSAGAKLEIMHSATQLRLSYDGSNYADLSVGSSGNLTAAPLGDWIWNTGGKDIYPGLNYDQNLGLINRKYLTLHAAELWVETLVAQNTIATIGGRILIGPTSELVVDLSTDSVYIQSKYNNLLNGDRIYLESSAKVEFMAVTSAAVTNGSAYRYSVTRNLDGSGANVWYAGDAVFNTGQAGNGFIDLYSVRGVKSAGEAGPTIVGNVRNSTTFNDWTPRWAIGNLNGLYGYASTIYGFAAGVPTAAWIKVDPTNGVRIGNNTSTFAQVTAAGAASFTGSINITGGSGISNLTDATLDHIGDGTTYWRTTASEKTGASRAATAINSALELVTGVKPTYPVTPAGAGLFLGSDYMGYYNGSAWKTFTTSSGNFYLGGAFGALQWNGTTLAIVATQAGGTIAGMTIDATTITSTSGGNTTTLSSGATAFKAGPTGAETVTITQAGLLTATGAVFQTAGSGARVVMNANGIGAWDATTQRFRISNTGSGWISSDGGTSGLTWSNTGAVSLTGTNASININGGVFQVTSAGALTATSANITGAITATSGSFSTATSGSRVNLSSGTVTVCSTSTTYGTMSSGAGTLDFSVVNPSTGGGMSLTASAAGGLLSVGGVATPRWWGYLSSDPSSGLQEGDMYFNSVLTAVRIYSNSSWRNVTP